MSEKRLPVVIDNYVRSECWTQLLLSIIQTSPYASEWIAAHIGIIGTEEMGCWYGSLSRVFSYRDAADILSFEETDICEVEAKDITGFIKKEIDNGYYVIVELKRKEENSEDYWIHEQLIFGYSDEKRELYGSQLNRATGSFKENVITYDEMYTLYSCSREHFLNPANKKDYIYWSRSNFLISRARLKREYVPQGCAYDFLQGVASEVNGGEYTELQYDGRGNVTGTRKLYTGAACLLAAEKRIDVLLHDRQFIEKDTDIEYNDLFGELSFKLARDFYKLYEHRSIILHSLEWFYGAMGVMTYEASENVREYARCCEKLKLCYMNALRFNAARDWSVLEYIKEYFAGSYGTEYRALQNLIEEMKDIWYMGRTAKAEGKEREYLYV